MKKTVLIVALLGALGCLQNAKALTSYDYEYDWVTTTPGFGGAIYLDVSSSSGGTLADISPDSYITTPDGTFTVGGSYNVSLTGPFTWTTSLITEMDLTGREDFSFEPTVTSVGGYHDWWAEQNSIGDTTGYLDPCDSSGSWEAARTAPDVSNTTVLFALGLSGLAAYRLVNRRYAAVRS